jgi:hypothetical protein
MGGLERLAEDFDNGPGTIGERARRFGRAYPGELAKVRRQVYRPAGLLPVPVNGSAQRGLKSGYFAARLRDGSLGYLQRRTDDCLQAALASCAQIPAPLVPDFHIEQQLAAGMDPDEVDGVNLEKLRRWMDKYGVTITVHPSSPTSAKRWIGIVTTDNAYSDHCLLMNGRDCLFDPAEGLPPKGQLVSQYDVADIDYGLTIEKR